jgi:hypothetical protein
MDRLLAKVRIHILLKHISISDRNKKLLPGMDLTQEVDKLLDEVEEPNEYNNETSTTVQTEGKLTSLDLNPPEHRFFGKSRCILY